MDKGFDEFYGLLDGSRNYFRDMNIDIDLLNGFLPGLGNAFQVLTAKDGVSGAFSQSLLPTLPTGRFWNVLYGTNSVILAVAPTASLSSIPGDFNLDGSVDTADYTIWRDHAGTASAAADANFDGQVTAADYHLWRAHFGFSLTGSGFAAISLASVPEPAAIALAMTVIVGLSLTRTRNARRRGIRHGIVPR